MNPEAARRHAGLAEPMCCAIWAAVSVGGWAIALIVLSAEAGGL
jgi:hypothetical protein